MVSSRRSELKNVVVVDISHLLKSQTFAGIQRVLYEIFLVTSQKKDFLPILLTNGKALAMPFGAKEDLRLKPHQVNINRAGFFNRLRSFQSRLVKNRLFLPELLLSKIFDFLNRTFLRFKVRNWPEYSKISNSVLLIVHPVHDRSTLKALIRRRDQANNLLAVVVHDLLPVNKPEFFPKSRLESFERYLKFTRKADLLFFVSQKTKDDYCHYFGLDDLSDASQNFWVVNPNGLIPQAGSKKVFRLEEKSTPNVLCVSTFEPRKNHVQLLEACSVLWESGLDFTLTLAGSTGWSNDAIKKKIQDVTSRFPTKLKVVVNPSDSELTSAYFNATFCVYPAIDEGFGIPVIESISFGKRILCADVPAIKGLDQSDYLLLNGKLDNLIASLGKFLVDFQESPIKTKLNSTSMGDMVYRVCRQQLNERRGGI
jgi:glycosyltransferase involved in cell wall biosynthesis